MVAVWGRGNWVVGYVGGYSEARRGSRVSSPGRAACRIGRRSGGGGAPAAPGRALGGCLVFPGFVFAWGALLSVVGKAGGGSMFWPSGSEDVIELELRFSASSHVPCL